MGSICRCYKKEIWAIVREGIFKLDNNHTVYNVRIGEVDDYCSRGYLTIWILKENYKKIMDGEYSVVNQPYKDPPILIIDSNNNNIDLLKSPINGDLQDDINEFVKKNS